MSPALPVELTPLTQGVGFGASALGELFRKVTPEDALLTLEAAWNTGTRYFDTSPWYGLGLSELRVGQFLRDKHRDDFVVSTKVGRVLTRPRGRTALPWRGGLRFDHHVDYSYDGIMRSHEDSLQRLGLERVDILYIHDLDEPNLGSPAAVEAGIMQLIHGGFRALEELRAEGAIAAFGAGVNERGMIRRLLQLADLDLMLFALRYTIAEHDSIDDDMALCHEQGIGVVAAGVFNSGLYATGAIPHATYNYRSPTPDEIERCEAIAEVCSRHGTALSTAALQFPGFHPTVVGTVVGADRPEHVARSAAHYVEPVPQALWDELRVRGLIRDDVPTTRTHEDAAGTRSSSSAARPSERA
ncbi:aldo/keto reductase [Agromyces silvae]|uniref:aldo/keto reductase n=1 Tax=Agromyces silvae TaxID=3388266 RepID=UPI00280C3270|nr:aldo/keto reductase [Agromyces protaetiae]